MRIKSKTRKWLLHYYRIGFSHENFAPSWPEDADGASSLEAFIGYESRGIKLPVRDSTTIKRIMAGKRVHGITVDMWARDFADRYITREELKRMCNDVPSLYEEVICKSIG